MVVSVYPILQDSMNTNTGAIPFSSHVKVPDYWYQATDWVNDQPGDWKVLLTPLDDFYQIPYSWGANESNGYYGSDQLMERLFEKPIVSTANLNGYVGNSNSSLILMQIRTAVKFDRIDEFKAFLDLLSIKYIVQRNDVNDTKLEQFELRNNVNITTYGRDLENPGEMRAFFNIQP